MLRTIFYVLGFVFLITSCKSVTIPQGHATLQPITLGCIGQDNGSLIKTRFNATAIPDYEKPIKVMVTHIPFTKSTYKQYLKANTLQAKHIEMRKDSIAPNPSYVQLHITDKVTLLNALNANTNTDIKDYLSNHANANIITKVSIALRDEKIKQLVEAQEVFLEQNGNKSYAIKTYRDNKPTATIHFSDGVIFAYQSNNSCWKEDSKYQLNIIDLINPLKSCPKKTYRSAKRAKTNINYFKL